MKVNDKHIVENYQMKTHDTEKGGEYS